MAYDRGTIIYSWYQELKERSRQQRIAEESKKRQIAQSKITTHKHIHSPNEDIYSIPLHEILLCNGYSINKTKSSANYPVMQNKDEKLIIFRRDGHYFYFNSRSDERGNIVTFCRNRHISIQEVLHNYRTKAQQLESSLHLDDTRKQENQKKALKDFSAFNLYNPQRADFFIKKGIDATTLDPYLNPKNFKQDKEGNPCFAHYGVSVLETRDQEGVLQSSDLIVQVGYSKRLITPLIKDLEGNIRETPLKSIHYGKKGLEILFPNLLLDEHSPQSPIHQLTNIIITENIIDALSFMQLHKHYNPHTTLLISTAGQFSLEKNLKPLLETIKDPKTPDFQKFKVDQRGLRRDIAFTLAFDNDAMGEKYTTKVSAYLMESFKITPTIHQSFTKDVNDDLRLCQQTGLKIENLNVDTLRNALKTILRNYQSTSHPHTKKTLATKIANIDQIFPLKENFKQKFAEIHTSKNIEMEL
ncbi:toprim domain-containing protein [Helicobacter suis]|uniref:toprim domain-containing protein n=1 Tax=Helicobacter suis TaxID=104628 RepID=UPI002490FC99|nr:toprim domain-containing protein [Helicobacter suis]